MIKKDKFIKKPVEVSAYQWFTGLLTPDVSPWKNDIETNCKICHNILGYHGSIKTLEGNSMVCPGDWIITGIKGEIHVEDIIGFQYHDEPKTAIIYLKSRPSVEVEIRLQKLKNLITKAQDELDPFEDTESEDPEKEEPEKEEPPSY